MALLASSSLSLFLRPQAACRAAQGLQSRRFDLQRLPRPSAVETDKLGAVRVQDVRRHVPLLTLFRKDHDHEPTCSHIVDVMPQMLEFLSRPCDANQCPLELC